MNYKIGDKIIYRYAFGVFCGEVVQVEGDLLKIRAKFNQPAFYIAIHVDRVLAKTSLFFENLP